MYFLDFFKKVCILCFSNKAIAYVLGLILTLAYIGSGCPKSTCKLLLFNLRRASKPGPLIGIFIFYIELYFLEKEVCIMQGKNHTVCRKLLDQEAAAQLNHFIEFMDEISELVKIQIAY